jgi:SAM-dependent methyltransferase
MPFRTYFPKFLNRILFGDRENFGPKPDLQDPDWVCWQKLYADFYKNTQKNRLGNIVNESGYTIFQSVDLTDKVVFELGPGILPHTKFWNGIPKEYIVADIKEDFLAATLSILNDNGIPSSGYIIDDKIPLPPESCDVVVSFYCLEHIHELRQYLHEINTILKPNGLLIGAIPAEGGVAWGFSRCISTRRYLIKHGVNPDNITRWEHVNFSDEILKEMNAIFEPVQLSFWPLRLQSIDLNLVIKFIYRKK